MENKNNQKTLSEVFRELETTRNKQVAKYESTRKEREQTSFMFHIKHRNKRDNIKLIFIVLVVLLTFSMFSSNYIFAKDLEVDEVKQAIGIYEENLEPKDVYGIISSNISSTYQKEIFDREEEIEFEIEYISNKDMPDGETNLIQEGLGGLKKVTYVRSFENDQMIEENSIGEVILNYPQKEIIEIGSSQVLKDLKIHIGDTLYLKQDAELKKNMNLESVGWFTIPCYYDVKTLEIIDDSWFKVSYNGSNTGYILSTYLTSEAITPGSIEACKKAKILNKVNFNMALNEPSGLSEDDYRKVLLYHEQDTNNVFKENYKAFFDAEKKYGINGVFLASIAIHESNWGRSRIAMDKKNLFGFGAYDASPYDSAITFDTYATGIDTVAGWLSSNYLYPSGSKLKTGDIASR